MAEILYESNYYGVSSLGDSLEHHGIKGQKWGIRRFQNPDGSLTALGKQRYGTVENFKRSQDRKATAGRVARAALSGSQIAVGLTAANALRTGNFSGVGQKMARSGIVGAAVGGSLASTYGRLKASHTPKKEDSKELQKWKEQKKEQRKETAKKVLKIGAGVAATGAAAYAAYRIATRPSSLAKTLGSIKKMSDEELLARLGRLEREKKVLDIMREQQGLYESNTKKILKAAGKGAATTVASAGALYGAKQGIKYAAKRAGKDGDKLIREMFPKKK